ncbi:choline BCCT transporter BetT [Nesterenkonia xinjiangensis]|uniref:Choline/glycine/proline betaine transport protein n=1 Tax=Nesterenkonia xinjiangensis TaxID=225327 RepID=A0A7Z0KAQ8_9MICC|nr:choline BCCT transporter BetT [Nesterenkonia xinjiangensis]NYJ76867.1 choline/glycine/proline betaine transport protein [Nesterenkonia xinjiangensis]
MAAATDHSPADAEKEGGSGTGGRLKNSKLNPPVFFGAAAIIVAFTIWAWLAPDTAYTTLEAVFLWIGEHLGWYYILTAGVVVVFVLIVAFSRVGRTKMGPDHSTPKYNLFTWTAMLFAAGIGVDLMFFAISGPATNLTTAPGNEVGSSQATEMAVLWTLFHYGIPGWAMYALMGMAFGLFAYRYHMPLSIRSALYPIIGKRAQGAAGHGIEIAAVIGTIFGIATSLGIGVVFLNYGLELLFGIPQGTAAQVGLIILAAIVVTFSTVSGVDKGIRRLSELNVIFAVLLLLYVLIAGHTTDLLNALVKNIGDFAAYFPSMLLDTFAYDPPEGQWLEWWTLFFWAWWIAWAPFVGLFLARISRGRTLRQFVVGTLIIPFGFILLWISIFGNGAIWEFISGNTEFLTAAVETPESGYYMLLEQYPGATFTIGLSVLTGLLFYITSADSGALVMSNFTSKAENSTDDGAPWLRIFWAIATGALTLAVLMLDGVYTLQMATVIIGLPFSVVMYLLMLGIWRALRVEGFNQASQEASLPWMLSGRIRDASDRGGGWRRRLARHMTFPTAKQVTRYLEETAIPAVEEVAAELKDQGADVTCTRGLLADTELPQIDLHVRFGDQNEFKYQVYPIAYSAPNFAQNMKAVEDVYFRVEIFSANGSQGHDIMGYTKDQVITDILDAYERHLTFLTLSEDVNTQSLGTGGHIPDEWDHDRTN